MKIMAQEPSHVSQHPLNNQARIASLSPSPPLQNSDNATSMIDPFAFQAKEDEGKKSSVKGKRVCINCSTKISTEWRRRKINDKKEDGYLCNACYCYEKLKGHARPKSMRKDTIQTRKRKSKASQSPKAAKKVIKKSPKKIPEVPADQQQPNSLPLDTDEEFFTYNNEINQSLALLIPDIENELGNVYQSQYVQNHPLPPFRSIQRKTSHQNVPYVTPEMGNHQQVYLNYIPEYNYRHDTYSLVSPNDIINVSSSVNDPSNGMLYTNC